MPERVGIGLVGVKGHGSVMLDAISRAENLRLAGVFDVDREAAAKAAREGGCAAADSLEELLADRSTAGVCLVTPNYLHEEQCAAAARAGKHVFVDKPIANTVEAGRRMIQACEEAQVSLMVGHQFRRHGAFRELGRMVRRGELGTVIQAECNFSHAGGLSLRPDQWRWRRDLTPGGPLLQLGVHCADTLHAILGPTESVAGMQARTAVSAEIDDNTVAILRLKSGALATLCANYASPQVHYIRIYGTKAVVHATPGRLRIESANPVEERRTKDVDVFVEEAEEFGRIILEGGRPETGGDGALLALAVVEAALRSNAEQRFVRIEELLCQTPMVTP